MKLYIIISGHFFLQWSFCINLFHLCAGLKLQDIRHLDIILEVTGVLFFFFILVFLSSLNHCASVWIPCTKQFSNLLFIYPSVSNILLSLPIYLVIFLFQLFYFFIWNFHLVPFNSFHFYGNIAPVFTYNIHLSFKSLNLFVMLIFNYVSPNSNICVVLHFICMTVFFSWL